MFSLAPSGFSANTFFISACLNSVPYWREIRRAGVQAKKTDKAKSPRLRLLNLLDLKAINQVQKLYDDSSRRTPDVPAVAVEVVDGFTVGREMIGDHHTFRLEQACNGNGKYRVGLRGIQAELVKWRDHSNKRRNDKIISRRHLIQSPQHAHVGGIDANLFVAFSQRCFQFTAIIGIDPTATEGHLPPMMIELLRSLGQHQVIPIVAFLDRY